MKKGKGTKEADKAIIDAGKGKIEIKDMLPKIIAAQEFIPLTEPPVMDGQKMKSWQPASVSHPERGDFLVAFTNEERRNTFLKNNPNYKSGMMLDTQFLIRILPPNHGILFNIGGESCFEWERRGILAYQQAMAIKNKQKENKKGAK